jgi:hypothetical protein
VPEYPEPVSKSATVSALAGFGPYSLRPGLTGERAAAVVELGITRFTRFGLGDEQKAAATRAFPLIVAELLALDPGASLTEEPVFRDTLNGPPVEVTVQLPWGGADVRYSIRLMESPWDPSDIGSHAYVAANVDLCLDPPRTSEQNVALRSLDAYLHAVNQVIIRRNRLARFVELEAPEIIVAFAERLLRESEERLIG